MSTVDYASILAHIEAKDLSPADYRTARRLLDRASNQWTNYLTRTQACEVTGATTWAGARRALNRLVDAGVIKLHTNNCAYISLLDRAETDLQRAGSARQDEDQPRPTSATSAPKQREDLTEPRRNGSPARPTGAKRAETDLQRADPARLPRDWDRDQGLGGKGDPSHPDPIDGGVGEACQDGAPAGTAPADAVRSVGLLTDPDIGLSPVVAVELAGKYTWDEVRRAVFRWVRDRSEGRVKSAGALRLRLAQPERFPATITADDRASPLWQRHHTDEETADLEAAENRRRYIPDEYADIIIG